MPETFGVANLETTAKESWGALCQVVVRIADIDSKYQQPSALKVKTKLFRREEAQVPKGKEHSGNIGNQKIGGRLSSYVLHSVEAREQNFRDEPAVVSDVLRNHSTKQVRDLQYIKLWKRGWAKVIDVVMFDGYGTWNLTTDAKLTAKIKIN